MDEETETARPKRFLRTIFLVYLMPFAVIGLYIWRLVPSVQFRFGALAIELFAMLAGFYVLTRFLCEKKKVAPACTKPPGEESEKISKALTEKVQELASIDNKLQEWMQKCQQVEAEKSRIQQDSEKLIQEKETQISRLQQEISSQKAVLEHPPQEAVQPEVQKTSSIVPLETDTVKRVCLDNLAAPAKPYSEMSLSELLEEYLNRAVKIGNQGVLGGHGNRLTGFAFNGFTTDLRRLYDLYRWESETLFIYSKAEQRLLFANEEVKNSLGWNPEKFAAQFSLLLVQGPTYWDELAASISPGTLKSVDLSFRAPDGRKIDVHAIIGSIPSGAYKGLLIAGFK